MGRSSQQMEVLYLKNKDSHEQLLIIGANNEAVVWYQRLAKNCEKWVHGHQAWFIQFI